MFVSLPPPTKTNIVNTNVITVLPVQLKYFKLQPHRLDINKKKEKETKRDITLTQGMNFRLLEYVKVKTADGLFVEHEISHYIDSRTRSE